MCLGARPVTMVLMRILWICNSSQAVCNWQNGEKALNLLLPEAGKSGHPRPCPLQDGAHLLPCLTFLGCLFGHIGVTGLLEGPRSNGDSFLLG